MVTDKYPEINSNIEFIETNPSLNISTNPYNCHALLEMYESHKQPEYCSSCYWIPALLCDVLKLEQPNRG